ncbi:MAG: alkaline phosphatase family protein [Nitrospirae bacterium]|nr:alkaline phosphatase family protein [Nitrospirota bacterium]
MQGNNRKVMVVGLDGATFTLFQPLMEKGMMPNLKSIIDNGASGIQKSTYPPLTAPAWSSFATGKNPGKHGAYDFVVRGADKKMTIVNSKMIRGKKIWNIIGEHDKKVGIIHFPLSYPTEKVNGFMISGFISPANAKSYTYPHELYAEILRETGEYIFNVKVPEAKKWRNYTKEEIKTFIDKVLKATELRYKAFKYLSREKEWDFLYVLFMCFDKVQHVLWKYLDSEETDFISEEIYEYVLRCYSQIDDILGDILNNMNDDTSLIILSDHGFCSKKKYFYINVWLGKNGFLVKNMKRLVTAKIREKMGVENNKYFEGLPTEVVQVANFLNLQKTQAYTPNSSSYGIHINLKGRDVGGIVEKGEAYNRLRIELRSKLLSLRDEESGKQIVDDVFFSEQIYSGPFLKDAPDLVLSPAEGYVLYQSLISLPASLSKECLVKVNTSDGYHHQDGIFIAYDKETIKKGLRIGNINITDVAPTILYLMGLPVPSNMDGKVIQSIFEDRFFESNPLVFSDSTSDETEEKEEKIYTAEDERQIMDELKGLGYID